MSIQKENRRQLVIRGLSAFLTALILVIVLVLLKAYLDGRFHSVESLQQYVSATGRWGPIVLMLIQAAQVVLPVLPGFLGCMAGSVLYGPFIGFCSNYVGISLGSIAAFFLARSFGMPLLQDLFPGGRYRKWADWASRSRSYSLFLFAATLLPLFPDDYLCYLTGVSDMTAKRFILIILLGKPWCILAYSLGMTLIG